MIDRFLFEVDLKRVLCLYLIIISKDFYNNVLFDKSLLLFLVVVVGGSP